MEKYKHFYVCVRVNNESELIKLYEYLDSIAGTTVERNLLEFNLVYPNYILVLSDIDLITDYASRRRNIVFFLDPITSLDYIMEHEQSYPDDVNLDDMLDINQLSILRSIILTGKKVSIDTYKQNPKDRLVYETKEYMYPYERIFIKINDNTDFLKIIKYLNNTFELNLDENEDYSNRTYNYVGINARKLSKHLIYPDAYGVYDIIKSFDEKYYNSDEEFIENAISDMGSNYLNPNDILTMDKLNSIETLIKYGIKNDIKSLYLRKKELLYESTDFVYPFQNIIFYVESNDEIQQIYDYLEDFYDTKFTRKDYSRVGFDFPNYFFVPTLYTSSRNNYFSSECVIYSHNTKTDEEIREYCEKYKEDANYDDILTINELRSYESLIETGKKRGKTFSEIYTKPKNIYEALKTSYRYPYDRIFIKIDSYDNLKEICEFVKETYGVNSHLLSINDLNIRYPNYAVLRIPDLYNAIRNHITERVRCVLVLHTEPQTYENLIDIISNENSRYANINHILEFNDYKSIKSLLETGSLLNINSYFKPNQNVYESKTTNILNAFDLDDTLVFNSSYEENIKHLLLEYKTPEEIFLDKIDDRSIDISKLKYEDGRIYFNDPEKEFIINDFDTDWVRKKDRVYLTQPDEYLLTDESLPISKNEKLVQLYNSSENKCIITARLDKTKSNIEKRINELGIKSPNYGIFMLNSKYSNKVKFKANILIELHKNNKFDEINYYDDNMKLLRKLKTYLTEQNIENINLYKVTKDDIRKI